MRKREREREKARERERVRERERERERERGWLDGAYTKDWACFCIDRAEQRERGGGG